MRACRLGCLGPDELARAGWSGRAVASVSVWMPWTGRVDPNGLVRRGCCERVGWGALDRTSWPERVGPDGLSRACRLGVSWAERADPNGLVRTGCRERVGWDALGRPSRPEWVGPDGLSRACRFGCLGADESTRMGWSVHGLDSFILVRDGRSLPAFPCASGRCLPCFVPLSPMPRPHLLAPGRCLPVLRTAAFRALFRCLLCLASTSLYPGVAFLCFGLLPSVLCFAVSYASPVPPCTQVVASCSPRPASLSPRPRSFLFFGPALSCSSARSFLPFGLHSLTPSCSFAHAFLRFGPLPLALLTLPALLPVQKKTPEGLAFGGFRLLSVANYFARAFRLTSLAALSASFGFFEMALLSCASAAVRSPSLTAMTARR